MEAPLRGHYLANFQWSKSRVSRGLNPGEGVARTGCMRTACAKGGGQYLWHLLISIAMKAIMASSNFRPAPGVPDE